jgi:hypothetical protein
MQKLEDVCEMVRELAITLQSGKPVKLATAACV